MNDQSWALLEACARFCKKQGFPLAATRTLLLSDWNLGRARRVLIAGMLSDAPDSRSGGGTALKTIVMEHHLAAAIAAFALGIRDDLCELDLDAGEFCTVATIIAVARKSGYKPIPSNQIVRDQLIYRLRYGYVSGLAVSIQSLFRR
jgi:hypothetical protein